MGRLLRIVSSRSAGVAAPSQRHMGLVNPSGTPVCKDSPERPLITDRHVELQRPMGDPEDRARRPRRWEIVTTGFDDTLQGVGGSPYGTLTNVGLRVPTLATAAGVGPFATLPTRRYLFNLASFSLAEGEKARIIGYRQLVTLIAKVVVGGQNRFEELQVQNPMFRFADQGPVSWHLRWFGPNDFPKKQLVPAATAPFVESIAFRWSESPALLYETITVPGGIFANLTAYVPPNKGLPWGNPLNSLSGTFLDLRTTHVTHGAWQSLDIDVVGPKVISFMASVGQTNPTGRNDIGAPTNPAGQPIEQQFIQNFAPGGGNSGVLYGRVAGALIVEQDR